MDILRSLNVLLATLPEGEFSGNSTLKLLGLILLCALIIVACYYTTKFIGKKSQGGPGSFGSKNFKVIDTLKVAPGKFIQIIKLADKYLLIGVSKDDLKLLAQYDDLNVIEDNPEAGHKSFKEIIAGFTGKKDESGKNDLSDKTGWSEKDDFPDKTGWSDKNDFPDKTEWSDKSDKN